MKVLCIAVCRQGSPSKILSIEHNLETFSYFQRGSVQEAMNFFVQTVVERTPKGQRATVQENSMELILFLDYTGHVYVRMDGLASAIVTDAEYPQRVAFSILGKILDEFGAKYPNPSSNGSTTFIYPQLRDHLTKAQDPQSSDPFMRVSTLLYYLSYLYYLNIMRGLTKLYYYS